MKKLFTLLAFLTCFLGAKAANWVEVAKIDFSTYTGFPHYVMGYVPEWVDGVMTDYGSNYRYATQADLDGDGDAKWKDGESSVGSTTTQNGTEYQKVSGAAPYWHQYFVQTGIPTQMDGHYKAVALVKASESVTVPIQMRWSWSADPVNAEATVGTDWTEVEWEFSGIGGTSCDLIAQPGNAAATIEWKSIVVYEDQAEQRPVVWQEWLTNDGKSIIPGVDTESKWMGNAETPWGDLAETKFNDQEKNFLVCAWSKEKGHNMNENDGWDPFPANIEVDPTDASNHVFVVHGQPATTEGDPSAWDNQFWIQSPKSWKAGEQLKIHFRYKASATVKTNTQIHKQNPSDYLIWHAIGDITFTEEWQEFDGTMAMGDDMAGGWSIAFNLNPEVKDAVDFYFDDLSWQSMVLDKGHFVAASNTTTGLEYDFDNAIEFEPSAEDADILVATVGTKGSESTWVNQVMISTVRGNTPTFKTNTIKPAGEVKNDAETWLNYTASSNAKITLPGTGVWQISLVPEYDEETGEENGGQINFIMLEGKTQELPVINPNPTEIVVHGLERDDIKDDDHPEGTGAAWDNQFFIVTNDVVAAGESVTIKFKYKSSVPAKTTTQCHNEPGQYIHWSAIGEVNFTEEWQDFEKTFAIPAECNGGDNAGGYKNDFKSIAFNMAEIKEACDYYIKDVVFMLEDGSKSLIDQTGTKNFFVKEGAGTNPYEFGTDPAGIINVKEDAVKANDAIYNLAGQRVSKDYKGIVVKNGKKYITK